MIAVDTRSHEAVVHIDAGSAPTSLAAGRVPGGCVPPAYTPVPTYTPTPTVTPTQTKRPTPACPASGPCLIAGSATVTAGGTARFDVSLRTDGIPIPVLAHDMFLDPHLTLHDCVLAPGLTGDFRYQPWLRMSALPRRTLEEGVVYSCEVSAADDTPPGSYPLLLDRVFTVGRFFDDLPLAAADGEVVVVARSTAGATSSASAGGCRAGGAAPASFPPALLLALLWLRRRPQVRSPKMARPTRTTVAPSSTASSKSSVMPMESSPRPRSSRRRRSRRK